MCVCAARARVRVCSNLRRRGPGPQRQKSCRHRCGASCRGSPWPCARFSVMHAFTHHGSIHTCSQAPSCPLRARGTFDMRRRCDRQTHMTNFVEPLEPTELLLGSHQDLKHLSCANVIPHPPPTRVGGPATRSGYRSKPCVKPCAMVCEVRFLVLSEAGVILGEGTTALTLFFDSILISSRSQVFTRPITTHAALKTPGKITADHGGTPLELVTSLGMNVEIF